MCWSTCHRSKMTAWCHPDDRREEGSREHPLDVLEIPRYALNDSLKAVSRLFLLTFLFLSLPTHLHAQEPFRIVFWNVENFFDTRDNPHKNDNEFLPTAKRRWTLARYRDKVEKTARTLVATAHEGTLPKLIGLCEVENDSCLADLTRRSLLRTAGYRYLITRSPDVRGINVALLYQPDAFRLIQHQSIRIPHKLVKRGATRDILHVSGIVSSGDTLDVMVCHMPSRSGGETRSEPYRIFTAQVLKQAVDSVMHARRRPSVVVMGDFNDYSTNRSLRQVLCADGKLMNLTANLPAGEGTYFYQGQWGMLDQFLVSQGMLRKRATIRTSPRQVTVFRPSFLLVADKKHRVYKPFRTYNGLRYQGGYSDHLPIVMDLMIVE